MENQPRRTPRYSFAATAELTADSPSASATATVSELSLRGCRLQMTSAFPLNVPINLRISAAGQLFQSKAKIIYFQPGVGAGVAFVAMEQQARDVLRRWLDVAKKDAQPSSV